MGERWDPEVPFRAAKALQQNEALAVGCPEPGCEAGPGEPCRNVVVGGPLVGQPAHFRRLRALTGADGHA